MTKYKYKNKHNKNMFATKYKHNKNMFVTKFKHDNYKIVWLHLTTFWKKLVEVDIKLSFFSEISIQITIKHKFAKLSLNE